MPIRRFRSARRSTEPIAWQSEATALLIPRGYRVYRPETCINGEDLVLRSPAGRLCDVQLEGRPYVEWQSYGDRELLLGDHAYQSAT